MLSSPDFIPPAQLHQHSESAKANRPLRHHHPRIGKTTRHGGVERHSLLANKIKTGVFYRLEQSAQTAGGRGVLNKKLVISWQGKETIFPPRLRDKTGEGGAEKGF